MSWYELLLTIHILAVGLWFGSGVAMTVLADGLRAEGGAAFAPFAVAANRWAGRAHPAAAVVVLNAGLGLVAEGDLSLGEPWILLALIGWVALMALGGALAGPTATRLADAASAGAPVTELDPLRRRLLLLMRVESGLLVLVIADMVAKPG